MDPVERLLGAVKLTFPINRCHQRVVTYSDDTFGEYRYTKFPINRCHQRVVTTRSGRRCWAFRSVLFPINRCHQRVVTLGHSPHSRVWEESFQSIGVTSEW